MTKIERKVVSGVGNQTVDVSGYLFARVETDGSTITLTLPSYSMDFADDNRVLIPPGTTSIKVDAFYNETWNLHLQNSVPAVNQSELKLMKTESGNLLIEGDDQIRWIGQDAEASADISGLKDDLENLSKLYEKALSTKTDLIALSIVN
nr:hypothetical protein [Neobacillus sp. Marseille-Q6967]